LLDLFCGAGGASMGYHRAGFEVVGVDISPQPRYPFPFCQDDALDALRSGAVYGNGQFFGLGDFDAIHASPPCQAFTDLKSMWNAGEHEDLLTPTRELLEATGLPYVIENVEGAPMRSPVKLCGSSFGMRIRRHRLFETNWTLMSMPCAHGQQGVPIGVYGTGGGGQMTRGYKASGVAEAREVMETPWMTLAECSQAIPPAYTEFIGTQLMAHLDGHANKRMGVSA
jgi:DNA (cytosine-5)-methyltransferase 1